jgi:hypothetical protein
MRLRKTSRIVRFPTVRDKSASAAGPPHAHYRAHGGAPPAGHRRGSCPRLVVAALHTTVWRRGRRCRWSRPSPRRWARTWRWRANGKRRGGNTSIHMIMVGNVGSPFWVILHTGATCLRPRALVSAMRPAAAAGRALGGRPLPVRRPRTAVAAHLGRAAGAAGGRAAASVTPPLIWYQAFTPSLTAS